MRILVIAAVTCLTFASGAFAQRHSHAADRKGPHGFGRLALVRLRGVFGVGKTSAEGSRADLIRYPRQRPRYADCRLAGPSRACLYAASRSV
jgi:hypothetical protein